MNLYFPLICTLYLASFHVYPVLTCSSRQNEPKTITFSKIPVPIPSFGSVSSTKNILKTTKTLDNIKKTTGHINSWVGISSKFISSITPLTKVVPYLSEILTLMTDLISETNVFQQEMLNKLDDVEKRVLQLRIEGALNVLQHTVENLKDERTSRHQIVSELTTAVAEFNRILPIFTNEDSILYRKYFLGAPLFLQISGMFKIIHLIANKVPEYNNAQLPSLKNKYLLSLEKYEIRCIRARLAAIHAIGRKYDSGGRGDLIMFDVLALKKFPKYFCNDGGNDCSNIDDASVELKEKHGFNTANYHLLRFKLLTGEDEQLWAVGLSSESLIINDNWDPRESDDKEYEGEVTIDNDPNQYLNTIYFKLMREAIQVYQTRVIKVMEEQFESVKF